MYFCSRLSRLFVMLRHFPIESKGRRKKLIEVIITLTSTLHTICTVNGVHANKTTFYAQLLPCPVPLLHSGISQN